MRRFFLAVPVMLALATGCRHHAAPSLSPTPETATPAAVDSMWRAANALFERRKWEDAGTAFERLLLELPLGDRRQLQARFRLGEVRFAQHSNLQAVREFRRVSDEYPNDSLAPEALLQAGDAYAALWRRAELDPTYGATALGTYQELLTRYPLAPVIPRAQERSLDLQNRFAYKQYKNGLYYVRQKAYDSAVIYLKDLVANWPRSRVVPDALMKLIYAYRKLGYPEDVKEMCDYLRKQWPTTPKINDSCPAAATSPAGSEKPAGL